MKQEARRRSQYLAVLGGVVPLVSGCANENSIYRARTVGHRGLTVLTEDAKQRNVLIAPGLEYNTEAKEWAATGQWKACAEAAPDVFSALSTSVAADLGLNNSGGTTDVKAKAAVAIAEAAGTIERTQTVNLLRESMYRTCERYLSGGINESELAIQAGRDWRAMIAVLAIEQLTRAARAPSTILVAGSTTATTSGPSELIGELSRAKAAQRQAEENLQKLKTAAGETCPAEDGEPKTACEKRKADATAATPAAEAKLATAQQDVKDWLAVATSESGISETRAGTTPAGKPDPGSGGTPPLASDLATVANVIGTIAQIALQSDEMRLFCIKKFDTERLKPGSPLEKSCLTLLAAAANVEQNQLWQAQTAFMTFNRALDARSATVASFLGRQTDANVAWAKLIDESGFLTNHPQYKDRLLAPGTINQLVDRFRTVVTDDYRDIIVANIGRTQ